jgi:hypothetical protein
LKTDAEVLLLVRISHHGFIFRTYGLDKSTSTSSLHLGSRKIPFLAAAAAIPLRLHLLLHLLLLGGASSGICTLLTIRAASRTRGRLSCRLADGRHALVDGQQLEEPHEAQRL